MHATASRNVESRWRRAIDDAVSSVLETALAELRSRPTAEDAREIRCLLDHVPRQVRVRGLAVVGEVLAGCGQPTEALAVAGEGVALAQDLADDHLEASHRALRRRLARSRRAASTRGWAALTPAEWRVVEQVAAGLAYAEIAERLSLSRRTVEAHVGAAFRKLGVRSRGELRDLYQARQTLPDGVCGAGMPPPSVPAGSRAA